MKFSLVSLKLVCQGMESYNYFNVIMGFTPGLNAQLLLALGMSLKRDTER